MSKTDFVYGVTIVVDGWFSVEVVWPNEGVQSVEYEGHDFAEALKVALREAKDACFDVSVRFLPRSGG